MEEDGIKHLSSVLTAVNGRIVYAAEEFQTFDPPALPVSPTWSPVAEYGGYARYRPAVPLVQSCNDACVNLCGVHRHAHAWAWRSNVPAGDANAFWGALGCSCFAF
jgi:hypothetical protein